jgi:murein DD-endopeptidase MepM/ murein hydrolase activator NlpD
MRPARALPAFGVLFAVLVAMVPARADVTYEEVERARQEVREVTAALEEQVAEYEAALVRSEALDLELEELLVDIAAKERELTLARLAARDRVADMYMAAGASAGSNLVTTEIERAPARMAYLDTVAEADRAVMNRLEAARRDFLRQQGVLEELQAEQEALGAQVEDLINVIYTELEEANAAYQAVKTEWDLQEAERIRREEEERRRREYEAWLATSTTTTIPSPTSTRPGDSTTTTAAPPPPPPPPNPGTRVCPVDGATTFRDSWGEPRGEGRTHTGTDMMAAAGTPLIAIESGVIYHPSWHWAGGNGLYINGDSGDTWYYAHMQGYAAGITGGVRVTAGQLVGYVGSTGNARSPHLHIAYIVGGTSYQNPYPIMDALCR